MIDNRKETLESALKEYIESYIQYEAYSIEIIVGGIRAASGEEVQKLIDDFDDDELEDKIMDMVKTGQIDCQYWEGAPNHWLVNRNKSVLAGPDVCCIDHTEAYEDGPDGMQKACKCLCCNPEKVDEE